jgi:hypothetical protein
MSFDFLNATPAPLDGCVKFVKEDSGIKFCNRKVTWHYPL